MTATAEEKNIELIREVERDTYVYADNNMLNTIMRNLVSNALKFTDQSGKIIISAKDFEDDRLLVSVTDTGIGMSDEAKDKIFRIDSKYSTPGTNNEQGTGLGLILCKELVEKNNGEIFVESEKGKGTTFSFTLPKNESK
jgi:signal transduction histidine kinase